MEPLDPSGNPPHPPAPPRIEWLHSAPPAPPASPPVSGGPNATAVMEFLQRRMEALERELACERSRSQDALGKLSAQEALKAEVESHLKTLTDQLRREKSERDGEEARVHARGRIESLEKRLDEMNATFAQLLKEAVSRREKEDSSTTGPDENIHAQGLGRRLDEFGQRVLRSLDEWKRSQQTERQRLDERLDAMSRERAELARLWDDQARTLREEQFKDRLARESEVSRQVASLAARLESLEVGQESSTQGLGVLRENVERVLSILTASPKTQDVLLTEARTQNDELRRALDERQEALRRFAVERNDVERSMGESLVRLSAELEEERARTRAADARGLAALGEVEQLKVRTADLARALKDRDDRLLALNAERDELAKSFLTEAEKVRAGVEDRRAAEAAAQSRIAEIKKLLEEESSRRVLVEGAAADARARLASLADRVARSYQENDSVQARFSDWEKERQRLIETIRKKDEMIALFSSAMRGAIDKNA